MIDGVTATASRVFRRNTDTSVDVLFDARHIRQSGIGTYIRTQLPHLERSLAQRGRSLAVLADRTTQPPVAPGTQVLVADPCDARMYSAAEQLVWDRVLAHSRPRAVWLPHYPFPLTLFKPSARSTRLFVTVHDTIHLEDRRISNQNRPKQMYGRVMLEIDARRCAKIFTPSSATADAVTRVTPGAEIVVTPIPLDDVWFSPVDRTLAPVREPYVLYVGNVKRHKNLHVLLDAYAEVADVIPQKLVIAGGGETLRTLDERIDARAASLGDRVEVAGRLPFDTLRALMAQADLLVMPSLYEGAGLPPLEAMASRTAVVSSNIPALVETCGDGADYFDPRDHRKLAQLLRTLGNDAVARGRLADRGWAHVTKRQSEIRTTTAADAICAALES